MSAVPALSVVMPARNALPYLDAAIESMAAQTFTDFELVIRDDGSTDGTTEALRSWARREPRIRLFEGERLGLAGSSNWIVRQARAPLIARMDADDVARPDRLERQIQVLRQDPRIQLVGSLFDTIDHEGRKLRGVDYWRLVRRSWFPPFAHTTIMFRRTAFDAIGGYSQLHYCEDWDFYLRLCRTGIVAVVAEPLVAHRIAMNSASGDPGSRRHVQESLDFMLRATADSGSPESYRPAAEAEETVPGRLHPFAIVASNSTSLWAGGSPRILAEMVKKGRIGFDAESASALAWAGLAQLSPSALRLALRTLRAARNLAARPRIRAGETYEWRPGRRPMPIRQSRGGPAAAAKIIAPAVR